MRLIKPTVCCQDVNEDEVEVLLARYVDCGETEDFSHCGISPRVMLRYSDGYTRPLIVDTHLQITGLWHIIGQDIKKLLLYTEFRMQVFWHYKSTVNTERIRRQRVRIALESRQAEAQSCCTAWVTNVEIYHNEETDKHSLEQLLETLEQTV